MANDTPSCSRTGKATAFGPWAKRRSLMATLLVATVVAALSPLLVPALFGHLRRYRICSALTTDDLAQRQWALNALIRTAAGDGQLVECAARASHDADHENMVQLLNALRLARQLDHPAVLAAVGDRLVLAEHADALQLWRLVCDADLAAKPPLADALIKRLQRSSNDEPFLEIAAWIQETGHWHKAMIPKRLRAHRLSLLATSGDPVVRTVALQRAMQDHDLAALEVIQHMVSNLIHDGDTTVRDTAVSSAARFAHLQSPIISGEAHSYAEMLGPATRDRDLSIAFRTWILRGLLAREGTAKTPALEGASLPTPAVAMAATWAAGQVNANNKPPPPPPPDNLATVDVHGYVLATGCRQGAVSWLEARLDDVATRLATTTAFFDQDIEIAWRLLLSLQHARNTCGTTPTSTTAVHRLAALAASDERFHLLHAPTSYCAPRSVLENGKTAASPLARFAAIEGGSGRAIDFVPQPRDPPILKVWATDIALQPDARWLEPAFRSSSAPMRHLACLVAARRFDGNALDGMIDRLLADYDDDGRRSGALLSGLTGRRAGSVAARLGIEIEQPLRVAMQVGLWMQGRAGTAGVPNLELRSHGAALVLAGDLCQATLHLALLHRGQSVSASAEKSNFASVLFDLFALDRDGTIDLVKLMVEQRWCHVLQNYAPSSAPPFWPWADGGLLDFQLAVLREWALLHHQISHEGFGGIPPHEDHEPPLSGWGR